MSRDYIYFVLGFRWSADISYFCFWMLMLMESWQYVVVDVVCSAHCVPTLTSTAGLSTSLFHSHSLLLSPFSSLILSPHLFAVFCLLFFFFSELSFYMLPSPCISISFSVFTFLIFPFILTLCTPEPQYTIRMCSRKLDHKALDRKASQL